MYLELGQYCIIKKMNSQKNDIPSWTKILFRVDEKVLGCIPWEISKISGLGIISIIQTFILLSLYIFESLFMYFI